MANKSTKNAAAKVIEVRPGVSQFASDTATALRDFGKQGLNIFTQLCDKAIKAFEGEALTADEVNAYAQAVGVSMGWKNDRSGDSRRSEVRAIARQYNVLGGACKMFYETTKTLDRHDVVKLARAIPKHNTLKQAVDSCIKRKPAASGKAKGNAEITQLCDKLYAAIQAKGGKGLGNMADFSAEFVTLYEKHWEVA